VASLSAASGIDIKRPYYSFLTEENGPWGFADEATEAGRITAMKVISARSGVSFGDNWERNGAMQQKRYKAMIGMHSNLFRVSGRLI
jgi:hypothetical protein